MIISAKLILTTTSGMKLEIPSFGFMAHDVKKSLNLFHYLSLHCYYVAVVTQYINNNFC